MILKFHNFGKQETLIYKAVITTNAQNCWIILNCDPLLFENELLDGCDLEDAIGSFKIKEMPIIKGVYSCNLHVLSSFGGEDWDLDIWIEDLKLITEI